MCLLALAKGDLDGFVVLAFTTAALPCLVKAERHRTLGMWIHRALTCFATITAGRWMSWALPHNPVESLLLCGFWYTVLLQGMVETVGFASTAAWAYLQVLTSLPLANLAVLLLLPYCECLGPFRLSCSSGRLFSPAASASLNWALLSSVRGAISTH